VDTRWFDPNDPMSHPLRELAEWLPAQGPDKHPAMLAEAARGSPLATFIDELMIDLLVTDEQWDWNTEFDGAIKQIRADWRRRRMAELAARPLSSLSAAEHAELTELARS
ncbi:MAG: DNA primase, partial [Thiobacillus sp.]|nr:DNA primase [Thiobacillus sp.]